MSQDQYLETAVSAAKNSGKLLLDHLNALESDDIAIKQEFDYVTKVDHLSEIMIVDHIKTRYPDHQVLAEESGGAISDDYIWIIDPLDGTKNYIHGFPAFSISIALMHKSRVISAVIYDPLRDECFTAQQSKGAWLNGEPVSVSAKTELAECLIGTGFPFRAKDLAVPYLQSFQNIFGHVSDIRRTGSAALDLAYVASGRLDGFWEITLNLWDIAAGALLVTEAGGRITNLTGDPQAWHSGNIVVSNSAIHTKITDLVAPALADLLK